MANPRLCSIPGCCKPARSRGWCGSHYVQWQRTGDPIPTRQHPYRRKKPAKTATFIDEVAMKHQSDECLKWPFALRARYPAAYSLVVNVTAIGSSANSLTARHQQIVIKPLIHVATVGA